MGKSKAPAKVVKAEPEPSREPMKVSNLYEAGALKAALDEVAREVVLDEGYEEDISINNVKIALGLTAIVVAVFSHFGPGKFPANWWMVFGCVVSYIVLTFVMNIYSWKMEGDAFLITKPFRGSKGLRVSSRMSRFANELTLVLTDRVDPNMEVATKISVPAYFHADGYMAEEGWRSVVAKLCAEFSQKQQQQLQKKNE